MKNYLERCQITPVYKNTNTIKKHLVKKTRTQSNKPCIYEIPCRDCNKKYIGESIDINRRKKQHQDSLNKGDVNSALHKHRVNEDHFIQLDGMKSILNVDNVDKRRILEAILIQNVENFNFHTSNCNIDIFTNSILTRNVPSIVRVIDRTSKPP